MRFEVSARTILQLGRELISSDGVAFYELIKNAFDAQEIQFKQQTKGLSDAELVNVVKEVWVRVVVILPFDIVKNARTKLEDTELTVEEVQTLASDLATRVDRSAPQGDELYKRLKQTDSKTALIDMLDASSSIEVEDFGEGMSDDDLREIYLLIGTTSRKDQGNNDHIFLGEKGIGRLSAMRLGDQLSIRTAKRHEERWNGLNIDWREFEKHSLLEDVAVEPFFGEAKTVDECGTKILIHALRDAWSEEKLRDIGRDELSRFVDPFSEHLTNQIYLSYNGSPVGIPPMNRLLFDNAHAKVHGGLNLTERGSPLFWADIDLRIFKTQEEIRIEKTDLLSVADCSTSTLESLGSFKFVLYWFNRQALIAVEAIGKKRDVQKLVNQWSGGLMLYRDGFRVPPYGGADDDWLDIDRIALSSQGYKVNRAQLIGKIDITKAGNQNLVDQTNREGLQDTTEKKALKNLMIALLLNFRSYINQIEELKSLADAPGIEVLKTRFADQKKQLLTNVRVLKSIAKENPNIGLEVLATEFSHVASNISKTIASVLTQEKEVESRGKRIEDLAGLGLLVDMVAHDLNQSLVQSVTQIRRASKSTADKSLVATLKSAEAQLKTLQKRVSRIDKAAISSRQRKTDVCVYDVISTVFEGRSEQLKTLSIDHSISCTGSAKTFRVRFVEGMLYQIFENLIENSIYWLRELRTVSPSHKSKITVKIDTSSGVVYFSDNGPGVSPTNKSRIFAHGFSLKRKMHGKGLGLYISKCWAEDQGASLDLTEVSDREDGYLNTFVLEFGANERSA
tara:strand:+ start:201185 stop:203563 length:2379 start_codon:yes stop_codon:yes gene_type:complete